MWVVSFTVWRFSRFARNDKQRRLVLLCCPWFDELGVARGDQHDVQGSCVKGTAEAVST